MSTPVKTRDWTSPDLDRPVINYRAADGIARIEARFAADAFAGTMALGYSALAKADYAGARSAFEAARRVRPNAPEIPQALRQIEQEQRTGVISAKPRSV